MAELINSFDGNAGVQYSLPLLLVHDIYIHSGCKFLFSILDHILHNM